MAWQWRRAASACFGLAAAGLWLWVGCGPGGSGPSSPQVAAPTAQQREAQQDHSAASPAAGRRAENLPRAAVAEQETPACTALAGDVQAALDALRAVGPKGAGHAAAAQAWQRLATLDAAQLPAMLAALDGANPLAANWIRTAVDAVAERALAAGKVLPEAELEQFILDRRHAPRGRRLAYELLCRTAPDAQERLLAGMLDDPSLELRRDAVARLIAQAEALAEGQPETAVALYQRALQGARDLDQIKLLAARLRKLGAAVDLPRHFGFIVRWKVIGPFDNSGGQGFARAYPPEQEVDFAAEYQGKHGTVRWIDYHSPGDYGKVDFNQALAEEKAVVAYAAAEFFAAGQQEVELRLCSENAVKLWLNGHLLAAYEVYHSGAEFDQYVARARLQPGRNLILVKLCQNEQTQEWARPWEFQLRVCDEQGTAVLSTDQG